MYAVFCIAFTLWDLYSVRSSYVWLSVDGVLNINVWKWFPYDLYNTGRNLWKKLQDLGCYLEVALIDV